MCQANLPAFILISPSLTRCTLSTLCSRTSGQYHSAKGIAEETIGNMTGAQSWQQAGAEERAEGEREYDAAQGRPQGRSKAGGQWCVVPVPVLSCCLTRRDPALMAFNLLWFAQATSATIRARYSRTSTGRPRCAARFG